MTVTKHPHDDPHGVSVAAIDVQIKSIDRDYQDLRRAVTALDTKIDSGLQAVSARFEAATARLVSKIDERSTTQWPAIFGGLGVTVTVLFAIGAALYMPIQRDTGRLDAAVATLIERNVSPRRYEADQKHLADTFDRRAAEMEMLRQRSYDQFGLLTAHSTAIKDIDARLDAISRRLAEFIRDHGKRSIP